jgi:hypothetical protein
MLLCLNAIAQEAPKAIDVTPSEVITLERSNSEDTLKLDAIVLDGKQLQASQIQDLRTRELRVSGGSGGDDVGNGGDELRQEFLFLGEQILQEMDNKELRNKLEGVLNIRRVIVVNNLSVRRGGEEFAMKSVAVEGVILLDAAAWSPLDGLLSANHDPRFEMLKLMAEAQGLVSYETRLLHSWHALSPRGGQIWCPVQIEKTKIATQAKDFEATASSVAQAEEAALAQCRDQNYQDCRIAESSVRGFGVARPYAKARGFRYQAALKTVAELKQERCEAVRQCEMVHEWAPAGQVRPAAFSTLESEASKSCR